MILRWYDTFMPDYLTAISRRSARPRRSLPNGHNDSHRHEANEMEAVVNRPQTERSLLERDREQRGYRYEAQPVKEAHRGTLAGVRRACVVRGVHQDVGHHEVCDDIYQDGPGQAALQFVRSALNVCDPPRPKCRGGEPDHPDHGLDDGGNCEDSEIDGERLHAHAPGWPDSNSSGCCQCNHHISKRQAYRMGATYSGVATRSASYRTSWSKGLGGGALSSATAASRRRHIS